MLCMQIMAVRNSNGDVHIGEKICNITLTEHSNNFQLLPPEVVKLFMDIDKGRKYTICEAVFGQMV